jgi:gliding motility-associated-like protein
MAFNLDAQTSFQKSLSVDLDTTLIRSAPDGQSVYLAGTAKANSNTRMVILRLDNSGNVLWQREYFDNAVGLAVKSIETVRDGLLLLLSVDVSNIQNNCYLIKIKTDGSFAWRRQLGEKNQTKGLEIKKDGAENFWVSGEHIARVGNDSSYSFLAQFDASGALLYRRQNKNHYFSSVGDEVYRATDLVWNPFLSRFFMVQDFETPYSISFITGPNRGRYTLGSFGQLGQEEDWFMAFQFNKMAATKTHVAAGGWTIETSGLARDKPAICLFEYQKKTLGKIRLTKTVQRPIHSQSGDIIFYDPDEKTLTKYDTMLTPIWSKKYDNCYITKAFEADIAVDGSIYTVRNMGGKTVASRILPTGNLPACSDYSKPLVPLTDVTNYFNLIGNFTGKGFYNLDFPIRDTAINIALKTVETQDYCFKLDAGFNIPDTVCLGTTVKPANVDTTTGSRHEWYIKGKWDVNVQQNIDYPEAGRYRIFHSVENSVCKDTTSRYVTVIIAPKLALKDTVFCGFTKFSVNLTDNNATRYLLNNAPTPPIFDITQSGNYTIRLENASCPIEKKINVKFVDVPTPFKALDSIYCQGTPFSAVLTPGFDSIFWDNKPIKDTFFIRDAAKHVYRATYKLDRDCVVKGEFTVLRKPCGTTSATPDIVFVPNVFSPNEDKANDVFQAYSTKDAEILSLMVYNRWGTPVFKSVGGTTGWDGKMNGQLLPPDVYVYVLQYRDIRADKIVVLSGSVTLVK